MCFYTILAGGAVSILSNKIRKDFFEKCEP